MANYEILHGVLNGEIVTIDEFTVEDREKLKECVCLNCGKPLIAVFPKMRKNHFKHKMNEEHCHYDINEIVKDLIWNVLDTTDLPSELNINQEKLSFFKIVPHKEIIYKQSIDGSDVRFSVNKTSRKTNSFILKIDDLEYSIKLYFDNDNKEYDNGIYNIGIKELFSRAKTNINIKQFRDLIFQQCLLQIKIRKEKEERYEKEKAERILREHIPQNHTSISETVIRNGNVDCEVREKEIIWYDKNTGEVLKKVDIPFDPTPLYTKIIDKQDNDICPWCGSKIKEYTNSHDNSKFRGCSNYPKCKYKVLRRF